MTCDFCVTEPDSFECPMCDATESLYEQVQQQEQKRTASLPSRILAWMVLVLIGSATLAGIVALWRYLYGVFVG